MRQPTQELTRLWICAILLLAALAAGGCREPRAETQPPNVLLIVVDDLNTRVASYGDPIAHTPNLDRLAALGVRFDRAYVQFPLCNPSRTSMLSGRYPETTQVLVNGVDPRLAIGDVDFLPEHFERHGYHTMSVGKIEHQPGSVRWSPPTPREKVAAAGPGLSFAGFPIGWKAVGGGDTAVPDGRSARLAVNLLEAKRDTPFFLAVGFMKPHLPLVAPAEYFENYPASRIRLPREDPDHLADVPEIALTHEPQDLKMPRLKQRLAIAAYYACVEFIDAQVGLLLDTLEQNGLSDSTIVVLVSDHGFHLGEHLGLWRKGTLFEQSLRVPLLIAAPGVPAGTVVTDPVEVVDIYPTLSELAGLPMAEGLQGRSLVPLMLDPASGRGNAAYSVVVRPDGEGFGWSIRTRRYRYSTWRGVERAVLYDHTRDPGEYVNLAADPAQAKTVQRMERLLKVKRRQALSKGSTERGPGR